MRTTESIHTILAKSYMAQLVCSMVGLFADYFIDLEITVPYASVVAVIFFVLGPALIVWAQYTSRYVEHQHGYGKKYFHYGPYRILRNPTHLGLLMLVAGYTVISGSVMLFATTVIGYLVSNIFFQKYESVLRQTAGDEYDQYKASVTKIL